jgi:hypothetical protein
MSSDFEYVQEDRNDETEDPRSGRYSGFFEREGHEQVKELELKIFFESMPNGAQGGGKNE